MPSDERQNEKSNLFDMHSDRWRMTAKKNEHKGIGSAKNEEALNTESH